MIVSVLMLTAGFLNPYGVDAMLYLFRSYGYPEISGLIGEMLPADINNLFGKIIFGSMLTVMLTYGFYKKGSTRLRYILLTLGTAFLALSSIRGFLFFGIFGFFSLSYYLKDFKIKEKAISSSRQKTMQAILIIMVCLVVGFGFVQKYDKTFKYVKEPESAGAVSYLLTHADTNTAVLYTSYDVGGYAEYMGFKCYIDPRAEVFVKKNNKKADIMLEYYQVQKGELFYKDFLKRYPFTYLLVADNDILYVSLSHDADYQMVFEENGCRVFQPLNQTDSAA